MGLRVMQLVSRVPSRLPKPQGAGSFRGAACRCWPAAAATRTWGRARGGDQVTRLLRLGSPRGRRAGKSQARVQEQGARPGGRPGQWRSAPVMSQGLQLLLLGCACSLAPALAMREVTVACSETADLPCTAPWDPQLSYTVSWAKVSSIGICAVPCGDSGNRHPRDRISGRASGLGTPTILIPHFLPPRFIHIRGPSPLMLVPHHHHSHTDHDQKGIGVNDPTRGFQGIGST
nr:CD83 antigen isoform X1 [Rattus norvegicus]